MSLLAEGAEPQVVRGGATDLSVSVSATLSDCTEIATINYVSGSVQIPSGSSVTSLSLYGTHTSGDTHVPLYDRDGAAITMTVAAGGVYSLPVEIDDVPYISLVADASDTVSIFLKG